MPKYIDANALCTHFKILYEHAQANGMYNHAKLYDRAFRLVVDAPTADVVEVVRCDHCENFIDWEVSDAGYCVELQRGMPNNGFCCFPKRKEQT